MKNVWFKVIVAILIVFIIIATVVVWLSYSGNKKSSSTGIVTPKDTVNSNDSERVFTSNKEEYSFKTVATSSEESQEAFSYEPLEPMEINGVLYKNVLSIPDTSTTATNLVDAKLETTGSSISLKLPTFNQAKKSYLFYENDIEIVPQAIYLNQDIDYVFYTYNNELYYIKVYKDENERIVYRNGITIYRNTGDVMLDNHLIKNNADDYYSTIDIKNIFDCCYLTEPKIDQSVYKIYKVINLGNVYSIVLYDNKPCRALIKENNGLFEICYLPIGISGNVDNYSNVFYYDNGSDSDSVIVMDNLNKFYVLVGNSIDNDNE